MLIDAIIDSYPLNPAVKSGHYCQVDALEIAFLDKN